MLSMKEIFCFPIFYVILNRIVFFGIKFRTDILISHIMICIFSIKSLVKTLPCTILYTILIIVC